MPHPLHAELEALASQLAGEAAFELCGLQVQTHRVPMTLLVQLRPAGGGDVSLDDCARFSGLLGEALETAALLDEAYVLEISSPGVSEELRDDRDFRSFRGFPVAVTVHDGQGGEQRREGLLLERDEQAVHLNVRGRRSRIPRSEVIAVCLTAPEQS
ncbi:ribosome maturation factor RimP [Cyanobium sp. Morenito 9A2]|uniref:ribosome maturation factor RimP n=1 Tax=Cyanobium sp. Morenito 9A2 TaxID=2823718 RepID=UPI0020CBA56C|nr:ribosome maturation factor RimP [Cyanobium sp. Morenito 9A2]MCP9849183.1 ribosome maturation factor RimP [Cyanobium sp. Morenito 9A2]